MSKYKYTNEELSEAVKNSLSLAGVCRILGIRPKGGNYKTLNQKIKKSNLDINHFTGKAWNQGVIFKKFGKSMTLTEILVENSNYTNTNRIRQRLIKENIKTHKCESCELTIWKNVLIPLELNHKNGINNDHRIENLELLCPNCHALTSNYRGKNSESAISNIQLANFMKFNNENK